MYACLFLILSLPLCPQTPPTNDPQQPPKIEPVRTSITVSDKIATDAPASITVLDGDAIAATPGVNLDDRLRSVPGFTLFRRASSLVANPTTQGVSLRGIGGSGASRTLVLWDGIPENDPFGGWVYWDRFAPAELDRVEISRGASTSVFGDLAMGGAIDIISLPLSSHFELSYDGGNLNTHELSGGASHTWRRFAVSGFARAFTTDGYFIVPQKLRGSVDTPAAVEFIAANARVDYFDNANRLFVRFDMLGEHRANGTILQTNSTGLGTIAVHYSHATTRDEISVFGDYTSEEFRAGFSSIAASRNTERLTMLQTVPSDAIGAAAYWRHGESRWHLLAGADTQRVEGTSTDHLVPTGARIGGGTILQHGVFAQFDYRAGPAEFFFGARHQFTGGDTFFSPSAGFALGRGKWRARGSVYRAFRAPTLNELFREFRQGNTDTLPNPALRPETVFGSEMGFDFVGESSRASLTFYRNSLDNLITNVTLQTGANIIRQRQNAAAALSRGIEATVRREFGPIHGEISYLLADSRFSTGFRISQVPRNQGSARLMYLHKGTLLSAGVRAFSQQFDDDLNLFVLPGFATAQAEVSQRLTRQVTVRAAFENLLDRQYIVALTPTPNTGSPRLWRLGLRWMR
jgi:outer membrane receptor protein involved in Fe transport